MKQDDADEFKYAIKKEVNGHVDNGHWELMCKAEIPEGHKTVPSIWSMQHKRDFTTNEIKMYKARLNVHGGKQNYGVSYFETYAPVVTWFSIRLMSVFGIIFGWTLKQIDIIISVKGKQSHGYALKLIKNLYGQKQGGRVWNEYPTSKLVDELGFTQSIIDPCVLVKASSAWIV